MELEKFTIRQARELAGLSQAEVAKALEVSEETYRSAEHYRTYFRIDKAFKFCKIVKRPMERIIFFDEKLRENRTSEGA